MHDAVNLIAHTITQKNTVSRQAIRDGLGATKDYPAVTGTVTYDNSGDAKRTSIALVKVTSSGSIEKVADIPLGG